MQRSALPKFSTVSDLNYTSIQITQKYYSQFTSRMKQILASKALDPGGDPLLLPGESLI
jgi:hypothetical protein